MDLQKFPKAMSEIIYWFMVFIFLGRNFLELKIKLCWHKWPRFSFSIVQLCRYRRSQFFTLEQVLILLHKNFSYCTNIGFINGYILVTTFLSSSIIYWLCIFYHNVTFKYFLHFANCLTCRFSRSVSEFPFLQILNISQDFILCFFDWNNFSYLLTLYSSFSEHLFLITLHVFQYFLPLEVF